ncbi:MAG: hypothetical protein U1F06_09345 [Steroidobacteraceae bacterium]
MLVPNPPQHPRGDFALAGRRSASASRASRATYAGIGVLHPELFAGCSDRRSRCCRCCGARSALDWLHGELYGRSWTDVGTIERLTALQQSRAGRPGARHRARPACCGRIIAA